MASDHSPRSVCHESFCQHFQEPIKVLWSACPWLLTDQGSSIWPGQIALPVGASCCSLVKIRALEKTSIVDLLQIHSIARAVLKTTRGNAGGRAEYPPCPLSCVGCTHPCQWQVSFSVAPTLLFEKGSLTRLGSWWWLAVSPQDNLVSASQCWGYIQELTAVPRSLHGR